MAARKGARFLAPLALAAAVAGTYFVVHQTLHTSKHAATTPLVTGQQTTPTAQSSGRRRRPPRFYVVKPGDNLSEIAFKTGVPLSTIEHLNPSVSANALQVGHRLRLR